MSPETRYFFVPFSTDEVQNSPIFRLVLNFRSGFVGSRPAAAPNNCRCWPPTPQGTVGVGRSTRPTDATQGAPPNCRCRPRNRSAVVWVAPKGDLLRADTFSGAVAVRCGGHGTLSLDGLGEAHVHAKRFLQTGAVAVRRKLDPAGNSHRLSCSRTV